MFYYPATMADRKRVERWARWLKMSVSKFLGRAAETLGAEITKYEAGPEPLAMRGEVPPAEGGQIDHSNPTS